MEEEQAVEFGKPDSFQFEDRDDFWAYSPEDVRNLIDADLIRRVDELERRLHSLESRFASLHGI